MGLSNEQRAALQARADGLRQEVSSTKAEAENALREKSQDINDEKLIEEVRLLEQAAENARTIRDSVVGGTTDDAIELMNRVAGITKDEEAAGGVVGEKPDDVKPDISEPKSESLTSESTVDEILGTPTVAPVVNDFVDTFDASGDVSK